MEKMVKKRRSRHKKRGQIAARKRRRLREDAAPGRGVTPEDRRRIFAYYGRQCLVCGTRRSLVLDHVTPLFLGGRHDPDNLQVLCWSCNTKKGLKIRDYRPKPWYY